MSCLTWKNHMLYASDSKVLLEGNNGIQGHNLQIM